MQSFPGRKKHEFDANKARTNSSYRSSGWSERQSKEALFAAKEKAKLDAAEFARIMKARRELPHLLNRALVI
jgi:hypothetical protein